MAKAEIYNGLGFPIILVGAKKMRTPFGEALNINHVAISDKVFKLMIRKPARFSGAELKFIRHHMRLTQKSLSDLLGVERTSISKWEGEDLKVSGMPSASEGYLRVHMAKFIDADVNIELTHFESAIRQTKVGEPMKVKAA
jgi:DNA-binding transcriptional regulator YiaG